MKIEVLIEAQTLEFIRRQSSAACKKLRTALDSIETGKNGPSFKVVFAERRKVVYQIFSQLLGLD